MIIEKFFFEYFYETGWFVLQISLERLCLQCFFPLPLLDRFLKVFLPTLFTNVLKYFLPLTTSAISGALISNKSVRTRLQLGRYIYAKKEFRFPGNLCKCTVFPSTLLTNTSIEWNLYLFSSDHLVTSFRLEMNVGGISKRQNKTSHTYKYKGFLFHRSCLSSQREYYGKNFWAAVWIASS